MSFHHAAIRVITFCWLVTILCTIVLLICYVDTYDAHVPITAATIVLGVVGGVATTLEKVYHPHPKQRGAEVDSDAAGRRQKMCGYAFTRLLLVFACIGAPILANLALFNNSDFKWCVIASGMFVLFLLLSISPAAFIYTRSRVKLSEVTQEHTPDSFQIGDRIRKYRTFAATSFFFGCCPCIATSGFAVPIGDEMDDEIYVVQRIDADGRRVLLSKDSYDVEGNCTGASWWDGGLPAYYRVHPNTHGPAYHYDCYQRVRRLGKGQSGVGLGGRKGSGRVGMGMGAGAASINDLDSGNFSPVTSGKEIKMMSASMGSAKGRSPLAAAIISLH